MAYTRYMDNAQLFADINEAIDKIQSQSQHEHVGVYQNQWQKPITDFGAVDATWMTQMKGSEFVGDIDFNRADWAESREAVDAVMDLLLKQLREQAKKYEGLRIDSYIRQGSAREGLKVLNANEFDTMLEFHIEGLEGRIDHASITNAAGKSIPGFCKLRIYGVAFEKLGKICPRMFKEGVFVQHGADVYLSSKVLHEKIFESMVDTARHVITTAMQDTSRFLRNASSFRLYRKMNPPAINVTIQLCYNDLPKKEIDVDLVPAFQLRKDERTTYEGHHMNCPIHAVCKWVGKVECDERLVWDVKTTGYEKHILDMARQSPRKLYIITALRIVKTYFVKKAQNAKLRAFAPPQIVTVLKSYHLKQIAFYLLFYLCHKFPNFPLSDAKTALAWFINLLLVALRFKCLPHFFYGGSNVGTMLPRFSPELRISTTLQYVSKDQQRVFRKSKAVFDRRHDTRLGFCLWRNRSKQFERGKSV